MEIRDNKKFKELVLYISKMSEGDKTFGATKLNKLLFYSDFCGYLVLGSSITGEAYQNLPQGPAPLHLLPYRMALESNGEAELVEKRYFGMVQERLIAKRDPDLKCFSKEELDLVNEVLETFRRANAKEISEFSHRFAGWKCTRTNEVIDYETALISSRELTADEIEYASHIDLANVLCDREEIIEL